MGLAGWVQEGVAGTVLGNRDQRVRLGDYVTSGFERPPNAACRTLEVSQESGFFWVCFCVFLWALESILMWDMYHMS